MLVGKPEGNNYSKVILKPETETQKQKPTLQEVHSTL
jgi:hypothetical protein